MEFRIIDWPLGANLLTITLDLRRGALKYSASLRVLCPSPALAQSIILERLLLGRKISQQRIQGVGGVVQCHGEEEEEATGDRAAGKRRTWGSRKYPSERMSSGFQHSAPPDSFSPTDLWSGSCAMPGFFCFAFVTTKGIKQGVISPGPFPCHPRRMRAKCQDMQMRVCVWGGTTGRRG